MRQVKIDMDRLAGAIYNHRRGVSEAAQALGVNPGSITKRLKGVYRISISDLNVFARFLGKDVDDFLTFYDVHGGDKDGMA